MLTQGVELIKGVSYKKVCEPKLGQREELRNTLFLGCVYMICQQEYEKLKEDVLHMKEQVHVVLLGDFNGMWNFFDILHRYVWRKNNASGKQVDFLFD